MGWKDLNYWLKGGILSAIIFVIVFLLAFYLDATYGGHPGLLIFPLIPLIILSSLFNLDISLTNSFIIVILLLLFFWFIVGAIIGWMYGKIKNRNTPQEA